MSKNGKAPQKASKRSKALDIGAPVLGGFFGPGGVIASQIGREVIHDLTGFNSRKMKTVEQRTPANRGKTKLQPKAVNGVTRAGGSIVTTQSAPVAFPRRPASVGTTRSTNPDGSTRFHVHDLIQPISTASAGSTFNIALNTGILATSTTLFPNTWNEFENFDRFKVRALRFHYDHFAPTSSQAEIGLLWCPDAATSNPTTTALASAYKNVEIGSCYEDFCLEVDPKDLARSAEVWYYNDSTAAGGVDTRFNEVGTVILFSDNNVPTSTKVGLVYVEAIIDCCDQRPASGGTGLVHRAERHLTFQQDAKKREQVINNTLLGIRKVLESTVPRKSRTQEFGDFLSGLSGPKTDPTLTAAQPLAAAAPALSSSAVQEAAPSPSSLEQLLEQQKSIQRQVEAVKRALLATVAQ